LTIEPAGTQHQASADAAPARSGQHPDEALLCVRLRRPSIPQSRHLRSHFANAKRNRRNTCSDAGPGTGVRSQSGIDSLPTGHPDGLVDSFPT